MQKKSENLTHVSDGIKLKTSRIQGACGIRHRHAADLASLKVTQTQIGSGLIRNLPSESINAALSSILTLATPAVAADSNGVFHPLGEHAETSFSIDGQPISDQQSRIF